MDRFKSTKLAGIFGIIGNVFLLILKSIIGFSTNSQAMIADAFNSAGDILASFFTFLGNKISSKPSDSNHNFGHGKSEYIFSMLISISMIVVSIKLLFDSISALVKSDYLTFSPLLVIVCLITIITKLILFLYVNSLSKKYKNILLEASAKDHFNDCIVTSCTLISILVSFVGIYWIDSIVGIGIALWIAYTGIKIFIASYNVLMDVCVDEETQKNILTLAKTYSEIKGVENLYSTPSGYKYIITLTILVDGNITTFNSHKIADNLEKDIKKLDNISDVFIHVNPI